MTVKENEIIKLVETSGVEESTGLSQNTPGQDFIFHPRKIS